MVKTDAVRLAQYVVNRCIEEDHPISLLQLQSVLWFADALSVARIGARLFEEPFIARPLGPRLLSVQSDFFAYGADPIMRRKDVENVPASAKDMLNEVLPYCLTEDRRTLSEMTRFRNGSYDITYGDGHGRDTAIDGPTTVDLAPLEERFVAPAAALYETEPVPNGFGL